MIEKKQVSQNLCSSGLALIFSGVPVSTDNNYQFFFWKDSCVPSTSDILVNPTGYVLRPASSQINGITYIKANTNYTLDNSLSVVIGMSVTDMSSGQEIYRDYTHLSCGNLCTEEGQPRATAIPTKTPTPTPTVSWQFPSDFTQEQIDSLKIIVDQGYTAIESDGWYLSNTDFWLWGELILDISNDASDI